MACKKVNFYLSYTFFQAMTGFEAQKKCKNVLKKKNAKIDFYFFDRMATLQSGKACDYWFSNVGKNSNSIISKQGTEIFEDLPDYIRCASHISKKTAKTRVASLSRRFATYGYAQNRHFYTYEVHKISSIFAKNPIDFLNLCALTRHHCVTATQYHFLKTRAIMTMYENEASTIPSHKRVVSRRQIAVEKGS